MSSLVWEGPVRVLTTGNAELLGSSSLVKLAMCSNLKSKNGVLGRVSLPQGQVIQLL